MSKQSLIFFVILSFLVVSSLYFVPLLLHKEDVGRAVQLFYYNPKADKDETGNILCSQNGLQSVERKIENSTMPIEDTINLLLKGELTEAEKKQGLMTEYPLPGLELKSTELKNGLLTLTFSDTENKTGGGSCRVGILWFQIEATAKQFPEVSSVRFLPEELFQP
ncbi:MAG: GerMN domain-containing protein [Patescibacteria group bacterium]|nr:GerMN domain-containing protein [bacterium]MDZ4240626.1 GerMN domain-containing protein [Patescibacteria group bacterium]